MLKLFKYLTKKDWSILIVALGFIVMQVWLDLTLPDYMSEITILVQTEGSAIADILKAGGMMLLCALGSLLASVIVAVLSSKVGTNFSGNVRAKLFNKVQSFSLQEMSGFSNASLITRTTNDITQIQNFMVLGLQVIVKAPIMAVWAIVKISGKSWQWSAATAVAVLALAIVVGTCIAVAVPKYKKIQALTDNLNRVTSENLTGLKVVRAYNAEDYQEAKFEKSNKELTDANTYANRALAFMTPTISGTMNGLTLAIYWIGAVLISSAAMSDKINLFSDMVVYSSYAVQVLMAFMMLIMVFIMLPRAFVSAKRINEVLDTEVSITDGEIQTSDENKAGEIEFNDVCFKYPGAEESVIKDVSFSVKKGDVVAFIGATGCGKSTIINLIPRFFDATSGSVKVDGVDVKEYNLSALRNKIGYASQKAVLFRGTVKSNVAYGDNGHKEDLETGVEGAVDAAEATEFVEKMDDGYDGYIAQYGSNLSGGQKQRISIARAICRKPEILIFDDSFSALDYKTDRKVRDNLKNNARALRRLSWRNV